jgi:hypothetical protein
MTELNMKSSNAWVFCLSAVFHAGFIFFLADHLHDIRVPQSDGIRPLHLQILPIEHPPIPPMIVLSEPISSTVSTGEGVIDEIESQDRIVLEAEPLTDSTTHYYSVLELSERVQVIQDLPTDFLLQVRDADPQSAIVLILINENGEVDDVEIETPDISMPRLTEETQLTLKTALRKMRFLPGKIKGNAVKSKLRLEISLETILS